jgi:hypothetical protein
MDTRPFLLVAMAAALTGCSTSSVDGPFSLATRGPVEVNVVSFNGDVTVVADPMLRWATIRFKRQGTHGHGRNEEARSSLDNIKYTAKIVEGEHGPVMEVRTWTTDEEPWFQRAHVDIRLPAVDGLTVRSSNGMIVAVNIQGKVDIECSNGDVRVMSNLPMLEPVRIHNNAGDIDYRVRAESTGEFKCHAEDGSVDGRARYGRFIVHSGTAHNTLLASFNDGTNPITLTTLGGDIRVAVVHNPTDVGTSIVTP